MSSLRPPAAVAQFALTGTDLTDAQTAMGHVDLSRTRSAHILNNHGLGANVATGSRFTLLSATDLGTYDGHAFYVYQNRLQQAGYVETKAAIEGEIHRLTTSINALTQNLAQVETNIGGLTQERLELPGLPDRIEANRQRIATNRNWLESIALIASVLGPPPPDIEMEAGIRTQLNQHLTQQNTDLQARVTAGTAGIDTREATLTARRTTLQQRIADARHERDQQNTALGPVNTFLATYATRRAAKDALANQNNQGIPALLQGIITHARNGTGGVTIDDNTGEAGGYTVFFHGTNRVGRAVSNNADQFGVHVIVAQDHHGWYIHTAFPA